MSRRERVDAGGLQPKSSPDTHRRWFLRGVAAWPVLPALACAWLRASERTVVRDGWILRKGDF